MNNYTYNEIAIGDIETFTATITEDMMSGFRDITGDVNPLHTDEAFATKMKYDKKVAYGMLTASFMSTVAGVYLPGKYSLIQKVEAEFPSAVYAGDTISFTAEVVDKDDRFKTIELKVVAKNSLGKKVMRGKMRVGVLR